MASKVENEALRKIGRGATIAFFGLLLGKVFGYLIRMIMARFYGAYDYGLFSLGSAVLGILTVVCVLGIHQGMARFIPFYRAKRKKEKVKSTIISGFQITVPVSIIAGILVFMFSEIIAVGFFHDANLTSLLQIFSVAIPISVILKILVNVLRGFKEMGYMVYTDEIFKGISVLLILVVFFYMGLGITGAVYAHLIAFTVSAIIGMHFLKKVFPDFGKIKAPTIKKKLIEFSWPLSVVGFLWMVVKWTDIVMLGYFNVAQDVGIYNIALPTAELLMVIIIALRYIVMPVLSELYSLGNKKEFKQTYHAVNKWAFSVSLPIFLLMAFFPATILGLLFGNAYIAASLPLTILAIGYFVYTVGNISNTSVLVVGKTKLNMATVILVALSNFVLNLILIPMFGIIGAAIATSTSFFVFFFASIGFCYKELHIHPFKMAYLKAIVAGFISIGVFYLIAQILFTTVSWWVLIIFFPFSIALYSLLFLVMKGLDKNDLLMLSILEKKGVGFKFLKKMIKKFAG